MEGPFQLADSVIDAIINNTGPAVFLLRRIEETPKYAHYRAFIGRTDGNLAETLKGWLGSDYRYNFGTGCHKPFSSLLIAERSATTRFHIGSIKKVQHIEPNYIIKPAYHFQSAFHYGMDVTNAYRLNPFLEVL